MTTNQDINLQSLKRFFEFDLKIKEILFELAPDKNYISNEEYRIKLSDKMFESMDDLKFYLSRIISDLRMIDYQEQLDKLITSCKQAIVEAGTDSRKINEFYANYLSNMSPEFIEKTAQACKGYYIFKTQEVYELIFKAKTINEFLHLIHSDILSDINIYNSMSIIAQDTSITSKDCKLYGTDSKLARVIFQSLSSSIGIGGTDVVGIDDKHVIAMVRDKGHALMIDINMDKDIDVSNNINIKYHIPKLCNIDMIKVLRGINITNENLSYAKGNFYTDESLLGIELACLVSNVPVDENRKHGRLGTQHFELGDILAKMDFPHFVEFIKLNPVVFDMYNIDVYAHQKYEYELYIATEKQELAIKNNESLSNIENLSLKIKEIKSAAAEIGINNNIYEQNINLIL